MDITGEYIIPAPRQAVWEALNDPSVLQKCIPGCEAMDKTSDTAFTAKVTLKVGAVKAKFKGSVELSDIDAPNSYTITGQGQGGVAGFAKGGAKVSLSDAPDGGTVLSYTATADLGGKLAAVGSRIIQSVAKKMADDFFGKFADAVAGGATEEPAAEPAGKPAVPQYEKPTSTEGATAIQAAPSAATQETTRSLAGTARDVLWFAIGCTVGALFMWALLT